MKLFIANCTKQQIDFQYRLPETVRPFQVLIPIGQQVRVHSDHLTMDEINCIVGQHKPYGLVPVDEIDRTRGFIGMCYSVDKEVNMARVMSAYEHNNDVLTERGQRTRQESAVAINDSLEKAAREAGGGNLHHTEVQIKEEARKNDDAQTSRLDETVNVSRNNPEQATKERGSRKNNRRS